jgi:hypothetical protein
MCSFSLALVPLSPGTAGGSFVARGSRLVAILAAGNLHPANVSGLG